MEKKNKRKFWGTLTSFLLTFMFISSWAVLGVALALKSGNVGLGGEITFTATDVQAVVSAATFTNNTNAEGVADKCPELTFDSSVKEQIDSKWSGLKLTFNDDADDVVITYTIKNTDANGKGLVVTFGTITGSTGTNATMVVEYKNAGEAEYTVAAKDSTFTLAKGEEVATVRVTFSVDNHDAEASITNWAVPVVLTRAAA